MRRSVMSVCVAMAASMAFASFSGCSSTMIAMKEKFGYAKREQLADKVAATRDDQQEAKQQFESALAEFIAVTGATDKDLEAKYSKLKKEYDRAESKADDVRSRIKETDRVSDALFKEWQTELNQYSDPNLRATSERQLADTQGRYGQLIGAMKTAASKMDPVLGKFKDHVLFLKHNLNAQAVAALSNNVAGIQSDVSQLIREMEASIAEADAFIGQMQQ
jgi:chromosome segregation ATPase